MKRFLRYDELEVVVVICLEWTLLMKETLSFQLMKELPDIQEKSKEPPFSLVYSVRARALIHAHLLRINLNPATLFIGKKAGSRARCPRSSSHVFPSTWFKDKNVIIKKCPFLLNEMISIVSTIATTVNANGAPKGNLSLPLKEVSIFHLVTTLDHSVSCPLVQVFTRPAWKRWRT